LKDSIHTSIEEQVAIFLLVVGHNTRFRALQRIEKLRVLSGALWDDDKKMILLDEQHYLGHTQVFHYVLKLIISVAYYTWLKIS
jgi:hypothetical protein